MLNNLQAKAYPYQQFTDDLNITAFFDAYNKIAQGYLTWIAEHPFAIYTRPEITGGFLNYCAYCLYGQFRYKISYVQLQSYLGAVDDTDVNRLPVDETDILKRYTGTGISDDLFKRILTWNFYKGDGFNFTIPWLKKRVMRFLTGVNGVSNRFNGCIYVSVKTENRNVKVTISPGDWDDDLIGILDKISNNGILNVPLMLNFSFVSHIN